jgi:deoxyhypusine synthase
MKNGNHDGSSGDRKLHNPVDDRLIAPELLDLTKVRSIDGLVRAMAQTAFTGRQLGEVVDVLEAMARDEECFVVMTLAGPMTVAKHGLIITELIDRGIVNAIVSTGALMVNNRAHDHAYDALHSEGNLGEFEAVMSVLEDWDHADVMCSYKFNHALGAHLAKHAKELRSILKSAYEKGVPVFVPAFTDSELGLDVALNNRMRESTGRHKIRFDPFEDLEHYAATLLRQPRLGIITIGGGVPQSWSQQFGSFIELRRRRMNENIPPKRYHYGVRICPEPVPGEAISWAKFVPPAEGGKFGEVFVDATVGLPIIVAAVLERLGKSSPKKKEKATARK